MVLPEAFPSITDPFFYGVTISAESRQRATALLVGCVVDGNLCFHQRYCPCGWAADQCLCHSIAPLGVGWRASGATLTAIKLLWDAVPG